MSYAYAKNYQLPLRRETKERGKPTAPGLRMVELNDKLFEALDAVPTKTSCVFCDWAFLGTAAEGRQEARTHRERKHPEVLLVKSKRKRKRGRTPPRRVP